jgi:hypothetical protein
MEEPITKFLQDVSQADNDRAIMITKTTPFLIE